MFPRKQKHCLSSLSWNQWSFLQNLNNFVLDTLILQIHILIVKISVFRGDFSSISANTAATTGTTQKNGLGAPWFSGSVDDAFALAKKENRSVFLYWGAVWCPPCNYLKSQVFDDSRFSEIMQPTVAVYLDGDSEAAQEWGAKFNAAGASIIARALFAISKILGSWIRGL